MVNCCYDNLNCDNDDRSNGLIDREETQETDLAEVNSSDDLLEDFAIRETSCVDIIGENKERIVPSRQVDDGKADSCKSKHKGGND